MTLLSTNTVFALKGDSLNDFSPYAIEITPMTMTEAQIVDEEIQGTPIKCIDFNTAGYLSFTLDSTFLQNPFTIEWWEKDTNLSAKLSAVFTNVTTTSGAGFGLLNNGAGQRNITNMSANGSTYFASNHKFGDDVLNIWTHRAVVFTGSEYRYYQNGTLYTTIAKSDVCQKNDTFQMGRWRATGSALSKKIYNFRIEAKQLYYGDFVPSISALEKRVVNTIKSKGIYTYNLANDFRNIDSVDVSVNEDFIGTYDNKTPIVIDTNSYDAGAYIVKFEMKQGTTTLIHKESINILSPNYIQESATYPDIAEKIKALTAGNALIIDSLKAHLNRFGINCTETRIGELIERLNEIKGLEFKDHDGVPVYLGAPKPVIDLDLASFATGNKELSFKNSQYKGKIVGDTYSKTGTSLDNTGTSYVDINYAPKLEGAIVLNFSATEASSAMYGRIFRASSDGVSLYYKQASGVYEIKFYGVAGGYIQNLAPAEIENKRLIITWSAKNKVAKLYVDGALRATLSLDPSLMQKNYALYLGDNEQNDSERAPYTIPSSITEFKAFDCYLDENAILEV